MIHPGKTSQMSGLTKIFTDSIFEFLPTVVSNSLLFFYLILVIQAKMGL